ncbi:hypothetical protein K503DRAFT_860614 [Rhizopogon vinicolor AM-OR11-026]|uniref:Uncharacterized protein n=1 Tax=Rhizopogon vinicolor AM-OR11-026 TaxID=1314800 RepID=A0A1B7MGS4_9AGAM|nr:hypothetical protein K503DRAFT_860614 [Rhizopogon vinicolor AM-OR11-026]
MQHSTQHPGQHRVCDKGHPKNTGATLEDSDVSSHPRHHPHNPATSCFISCAPNRLIPLHTRNLQQHNFLHHLRNFLIFRHGCLSSCSNRESS